MVRNVVIPDHSKVKLLYNEDTAKYPPSICLMNIEACIVYDVNLINGLIRSRNWNDRLVNCKL